MVARVGIEPTTSALYLAPREAERSIGVVAMGGVEPPSRLYEGHALPLSYIADWRFSR